VTDVVQERGGERLLGGLFVEPMARGEVALDVAKASDEALHHVRAADGVREPRMFRAWKCERGDAELPDAPQTLHLRRAEQPNDDRVVGRIERDETVNGVAKNHVGASAKDVGSRLASVANEAFATATFPSTK
jgi:hypothetical protein